MFKEGINPQKAINIIWWSLMGYANSLVSPEKPLTDFRDEYETYLEEMQEYFALFRKMFYK